MDKLDTLDFLENKKRELSIISKLIDSTLDKFDYGINSEGIDTITFLNNSINNIVNDLDEYETQLKEWCQMILINGIPASKELITIFSMVKGATLEHPVKTVDLKRATGLSERMIRDGINNLRFTYSVPIGSIRHATNAGYYFIRSETDLIACIAPIRAQAREELNVVNKLKDNLKDWRW